MLDFTAGSDATACGCVGTAWGTRDCADEAMAMAVGCAETLAAGVRVGVLVAGAIRLADRGTSGFPMRSFTDDSTCCEHVITLRVTGSVTITSSTHKLPMHYQ